ncbi:Putative cytokinin riboside 5'-monophosphate phosphoribohydrolase [Commensalibacter sp. Nvir]|uniref:LOG family protein n=1 Tax=Commensalibacter sp. Nvir TaxID=3069817 RepID=UPI002D6A6F88|nr:Putative cytokinin riboside 5'-monophosphate phosphoribohydrolase [Commensalibacter sp. Nvir]
MAFYRYSVTVFCGSRDGNNFNYTLAGKEFAAGLVTRNIRLIFGGGNVGIMGTVSDAVLDLGGCVKGIIPNFLQKTEGKHSRIKDLIVTETMHQRKQLLYRDADAFVCLPGGLGTFDEIFEIMTWKQLHLHRKPIIIANVNNWADPFFDILNSIIHEGFAHKSILQLCTKAQNIAEVFSLLDNHFKST